MPLLLRKEVHPSLGQVAMVDATWQDYPEWLQDDKWVAYRAQSLINPDSPPHPGVAVATRLSGGERGGRGVVVEVWEGTPPTDVHLVHAMTLHVGRVGVEVGDVIDGDSSRVPIPPGEHPLGIWVDADSPLEVGRVVFVLG